MTEVTGIISGVLEKLGIKTKPIEPGMPKGVKKGEGTFAGNVSGVNRIINAGEVETVEGTGIPAHEQLFKPFAKVGTGEEVQTVENTGEYAYKARIKPITTIKYED